MTDEPRRRAVQVALVRRVWRSGPHGLLAVVTIVLVLLTALGVG